MDVHAHISSGHLLSGDVSVIKTVDMHTAGEPTRIVVSGYPALEGNTLLEKRAYALQKADDARKRLMWEPRGHAEMYGAILVQETELTASGEADMGVLFCHKEGYSTMCGHATIALGRFLVDTRDSTVFPRRGQLRYDREKGETEVRLHAPCGVVEIAVPTVESESGVVRSDASRRVRFVSVESFVSARDVEVEIAEGERWARLKEAGRSRVRVDVVFGGAFYAIVEAKELGFAEGLMGGCAMKELDEATAVVKRLVGARAGVVEHPWNRELEYLYGVIVVDGVAGGRSVGLCVFGEQQVDRSPCGSGVSGRVALEVAAGRLAIGDGVEFDSLLTVADGGGGGGGSGFRGTAISGGRAAVRVAVEGRAFYTGAQAFVAEGGREPDGLSQNGFQFHDVR
ncbi:Diaminopimelate epimerase-like protein [Amylocystis lapponica]|nr:Diaminopimelate epimerase-like protein [Amylocystis lapponica]